MKRLLFLFLLSPLALFAQKEIPNKANCIIIQNNNTAYANFADVRLLLTKNQIEIIKLDKELFQIKTGLVTVKDGIIAYYDFDCRDNKITISGMWKSVSATNTSTAGKDLYIRIESSSQTDSPAKAAFEKMNELAKKFGKVLTYEASKYLP